MSLFVYLWISKLIRCDYLTVTLSEECLQCARLSFLSSQLNPVSHDLMPVGDRVRDIEHDKQCTYNVTLRRVRTTIVAVEMQ